MLFQSAVQRLLHITPNHVVCRGLCYLCLVRILVNSFLPTRNIAVPQFTKHFNSCVTVLNGIGFCTNGPGSSDELPVCEKPLLKRETKPFRSKVVIPAPLDCLCKHVMRIARETERKLACSSRPQTPFHVRIAFRLLKSQGLRPEVSDKDGVFTLIKQDVLEQLVKDEMDKEYFSQVDESIVNIEYMHVLSSLRFWGNELKCISKRYAVELLTNLETSRLRNFVCKFLLTIKTHKCPLKIRSVLSSVGHTFNSACEVVNRVLVPKLKRYKYIVQSSEDVSKELAELVLKKDSVFVKLDVQDFFFQEQRVS